jgi:hypothetical protein
MKKLIALIIALVCTLGICTISFGQDANKKDDTKTAETLIDVKVCPMTGEAVEEEGAASSVVGKYKVYFCCEGCKAPFDKLSNEEKDKKIASALEKQNSNKKENKEHKH